MEQQAKIVIQFGASGELEEKDSIVLAMPCTESAADEAAAQVFEKLLKLNAVEPKSE